MDEGRVINESLNTSAAKRFALRELRDGHRIYLEN